MGVPFADNIGLKGGQTSTIALRRNLGRLKNTNVPIVDKDSLRAFYRCFIYGLAMQVIIEKTLCSKGFTGNLPDILT